jgi:hypothetical protein
MAFHSESDVKLMVSLGQGLAIILVTSHVSVILYDCIPLPLSVVVYRLSLRLSAAAAYAVTVFV